MCQKPSENNAARAPEARKSRSTLTVPNITDAGRRVNAPAVDPASTAA